METGNLAAALINLVRDITPGFMALVGVVCWILGLILIVVTALRLLKHSDSLGKGSPPAAIGTLTTFMAGIVLLTLPAWLDATAKSVFGPGGTRTSAVLGYSSRGADWDGLLSAVFTIVALVGLVAFIRGIFVLRAMSDGQPSASAGAAAMHLIGGTAAWHIVTVIDAVQTTLGIRILNVS